MKNRTGRHETVPKSREANGEGRKTSNEREEECNG